MGIAKKYFCVSKLSDWATEKELKTHRLLLWDVPSRGQGKNWDVQFPAGHIATCQFLRSWVHFIIIKVSLQILLWVLKALLPSAFLSDLKATDADTSLRQNLLHFSCQAELWRLLYFSPPNTQFVLCWCSAGRIAEHQQGSLHAVVLISFPLLNFIIHF